jgi:hypothetical protein
MAVETVDRPVQMVAEEVQITITTGCEPYERRRSLAFGSAGPKCADNQANGFTRDISGVKPSSLWLTK